MTEGKEGNRDKYTFLFCSVVSRQCAKGLMKRMSLKVDLKGKTKLEVA